MSAHEHDERFQVLETRAAYQQREIEELNGVVFRQQRTIDALELRVKKMSEQLRELGFSGDDSKDQPPPHY